MYCHFNIFMGLGQKYMFMCLMLSGSRCSVQRSNRDRRGTIVRPLLWSECSLTWQLQCIFDLHTFKLNFERSAVSRVFASDMRFLPPYSSILTRRAILKAVRMFNSQQHIPTWGESVGNLCVKWHAVGYIVLQCVYKCVCLYWPHLNMCQPRLWRSLAEQRRWFYLILLMMHVCRVTF